MCTVTFSVSVKNIYVLCAEGSNRALASEEMLEMYAVENRSVFRCALKVVMIVELFVTGDSEFQMASAMMLNALDWKLIFAWAEIKISVSIMVVFCLQIFRSSLKGVP